MARKPNDPNGEPVRAISIVLTDTQLKNLDANIEKMRAHLIGRGIEEKKVVNLVNRSKIVRELVLTLASPVGYHSLSRYCLNDAGVSPCSDMAFISIIANRFFMAKAKALNSSWVNSIF